jgi:hypothetical protein
MADLSRATPEELRDAMTPDQREALASLAHVAGARYEHVYPARMVVDALAMCLQEDVETVVRDIARLIGVPPNRPVALPEGGPHDT